MKFLRFINEGAARTALAGHIQEGQWPSYIGAVAVDVIGIVHKPIGEPDQDGNQALETLPGFHINLSAAVPELADFEIEPPFTPARVFAGYEPESVPRSPQRGA